MGKPGGIGILGRPRHRWVNNIKMYLGEIGWCDMDWIDLAQDRDKWRAIVNTVMNLRHKVSWLGVVSSFLNILYFFYRI
jgi:hypothetical protein